MRRALAMTLLALSGASCTCSPTEVEGLRFACATTADCGPGFGCNKGECRSNQPEGSSCVSTVGIPCGASGSACTQTCESGTLSACLAATGPVDVHVDPANCGECGKKCSATRTCVQGTCTCVADKDCAGSERCATNGVCVPAGDPCVAVSCGPGQVCRSGACASLACGSAGCRPAEQCRAGLCEAIDGCHLAIACDAGSCEGPARADGTRCNDRKLCTQGDACKAGTCEGVGYACAPTAACQSSTCAGDGTCVAAPLTDGTACVSCGGPASCSSGVCGAGPSCPPPSQCEQSVACLSDGGCLAVPRSGGACDDNDPCTAADVCSSGTCSGAASPCPGPGPCESSVVCSGTGGCTRTLKVDGTACMGCGGLGGTCGGGVCSGGGGSCPAPTQCQLSVSCLPDGGCLSVKKPEGAPCDDGLACTMNDSCSLGACRGQFYVCVPNACQLSVACAGDGGCTPVNQPPGTACDDANVCTGLDTCLAGVCSGLALMMRTWYRDLDNDGVGSTTTMVTSCQPGPGYVLTTGDCDDSDFDVYRTVISLVTDFDNDGYSVGSAASQCVGDNTTINGRTYYRNVSGGFTWLASDAAVGLDCNDAIFVVLGGATWYPDTDADTFGAGTGVIACVAPAGTVANNTDCNNNDADVFQTQGNLVTDADNDGYSVGAAASQCVGATMTINGRTYYRGTAGTFVWLKANTSLGVDCYDSNANARPGQTAYFTSQRGDGSFDYNCNSSTELTLTSSVVGATYDTTLTTIATTACTTAQPTGVSGWIGGAPNCGQAGNFRHCHAHSDMACVSLTGHTFPFNATCDAAAASWASGDHLGAAVVGCR